MPYVTVSDVRKLIPNVPINATSQPSEGAVAEWITDTERVLDALFSSTGYVTPLTGIVSRTITKDLVTNRIAARVLRSRPNPEQDPETFQRQYEQDLKRLRDPGDPFDLTDAEHTPDAVVKNLGPRFSSNLRELLLEEERPRINRDQIF